MLALCPDVVCNSYSYIDDCGCGCAGIGRATVIALVECGAEVIALSRTESDLVSLKQKVL